MLFHEIVINKLNDIYIMKEELIKYHCKIQKKTLKKKQKREYNKHAKLMYSTKIKLSLLLKSKKFF